MTEVNPALPRHTGRILRRCLAKDPDRRYQTALDLRNELEELRAELSATERRHVLLSGRRAHRVLAPLGFLDVDLVASSDAVRDPAS